MSNSVKTYTTPLFLLLLIFSLTIIRIAPIQANPGLVLTVKTEKQKYYANDSVLVYGNLSLDEVLVSDGLVGIQLQTSEDKLLTIRTLSTGTLPPTTPYVKLWHVIPCNSSGGPQSSFKKGTLAYFKIEITNYDIQTRDALMTINTYYPDNTPFGFASIQTTLSPQSTSTFTISIPIPTDAILGTASAYANAYTEWPKQGGTPYCNEQKGVYQIIDSGGASHTAQEFSTSETDETGNFNLTLTLPKKSPPGNYTIYVTSRYLGEEAFNSTTFKVLILGDIDGDDDIDGWDLTLFVIAYNYEYNPKADLDFDGDIDGWDLNKFVINYNLYA